MSNRAHTPKPASRNYVIKGAGTKGKRYGKLTPRDRPGERVAITRYEQLCLHCGFPRGKTRWLLCADCETPS